MLKTLKTLSTIEMDVTKNKTLEELAYLYQDNLFLNPAALATAFRKTYRLIQSISLNYFGLSQEDIASFALEKLDYCLQTFRFDKSSFSTYFVTIFKNKLREETEALSTQKRKVIYLGDSYEKMLELGYDVEYYDDFFAETDLTERLIKSGISDSELRYCILVIQKYTNEEIAEILNVSIMTVSNIKKRLRKKLIPILLEN